MLVCVTRDKKVVFELDFKYLVSLLLKELFNFMLMSYIVSAYDAITLLKT